MCYWANKQRVFFLSFSFFMYFFIYICIYFFNLTTELKLSLIFLFDMEWFLYSIFYSQLFYWLRSYLKNRNSNLLYFFFPFGVRWFLKILHTANRKFDIWWNPVILMLLHAAVFYETWPTWIKITLIFPSHLVWNDFAVSLERNLVNIS